MEYTLLIAFLAVASIAVLRQVGVGLDGPWGAANTTLATANGARATTTTPPPPTEHDHDHH